jgi:kynurenine formamidase
LPCYKAGETAKISIWCRSNKKTNAKLRLNIYKYGSDNLEIQVEELLVYADKIKENDIVIINTGCYAHPEEFSSFGHLSKKAAEWLVKKKIKLLGVDTPSVDLGVPVGEQMPIHQIILGNDISIIEGLANLNEITQERFYFIGLPLKIEDADGGPVRAIAIEQRPEV